MHQSRKVCQACRQCKIANLFSRGKMPRFCPIALWSNKGLTLPEKIVITAEPISWAIRQQIMPCHSQNSKSYHSLSICKGALWALANFIKDGRAGTVWDSKKCLLLHTVTYFHCVWKHSCYLGSPLKLAKSEWTRLKKAKKAEMKAPLISPPPKKKMGEEARKGLILTGFSSCIVYIFVAHFEPRRVYLFSWYIFSWQGSLFFSLEHASSEGGVSLERCYDIWESIKNRELSEHHTEVVKMSLTLAQLYTKIPAKNAQDISQASSLMFGCVHFLGSTFVLDFTFCN